jgi:hypothetical protein
MRGRRRELERLERRLERLEGHVSEVFAYSPAYHRAHSAALYQRLMDPDDHEPLILDLVRRPEPDSATIEAEERLHARLDELLDPNRTPQPNVIDEWLANTDGELQRQVRASLQKATCDGNCPKSWNCWYCHANRAAEQIERALHIPAPDCAGTHAAKRCVRCTAWMTETEAPIIEELQTPGGCFTIRMYIVHPGFPMTEKAWDEFYRAELACARSSTQGVLEDRYRHSRR